MLFPIKNSDEMLEEMLTELETMGITITAGSMARSLIEIFNKKLNGTYQYFDIYTSMSFLSTSSGMYLDMIGEMLACRRQPYEDDENYKYRISQQVFTAASSNRTAIRLKCLSVAEVRDIIITPYSHGNGSFTVHVITDEIDTPTAVLQRVETIVNEAKAEGVRAIITKPRIVPINIRFHGTRKSGNNSSDITIANQIKESIREYVDDLSMGDTIVTSDLLGYAQSNPNLTQIYISSLEIDGEEMILDSVYSLEWDKKAYIDNVTLII